MTSLTQEDVQLIQNLITERNLKPSAYNRFKSPINKYLSYHKENNRKTTMTQLVKEAYNEQEQAIPPQKTTLYTYLTEFRKYLNNNVSSRTLQTYMIQIKEVYRHHHIVIPSLPSFKTREPPQITYEDIPTKQEIRQACTISPTDMEALILFQSSSGTTLHESTTITIDMFFKACKEYEDYDPNCNISFHLTKLRKHEDIIPLFYLERVKTNKYYYTCCSPEATKSIINYLQFRLDNQEELHMDSKIFPISKSKYTYKYSLLNEKLGLGFVGNYGKFRSHALRKFHASNIGCSVELIDELQGRGKSIIHEAYIKDRPQKIKQEYMKHMNNILIFDGKTQKKKSNDVQQVDKEEPKMDTVQVTVDNDLVFQLIKQIGKLEQRIEQLEKKEMMI
jgi:hypothetical protein